ncbi:glutathione S-transferase [Lophium mytilinum]|uniref:glutathione transferase n=1 Tax=Lophium mytilinum TaxID=390894 RepID=A0A6A6RE60_9PEZI|nr:glutathione S-transferase [Lophium mytilinum]
MTIILHHLQRSQSERIIWLCEELNIPYELKLYQRDKHTLLAPPEYKALHPSGTAPIIYDGPVKLAETDAITEYLLAKYAPTPNALVPAPSAPNFADYVFWRHFANGTLGPSTGRVMMFAFAQVDPANPAAKGVQARFELAAKMVDDRLGESKWLAGDEFSLADLMTVWNLTGLRQFNPFELTPYPNVVSWLERVGERPAYKRAMEKGDPGFKPLLGAEKPEAIKRG